MPRLTKLAAFVAFQLGVAFFFAMLYMVTEKVTGAQHFSCSDGRPLFDAAAVPDSVVRAVYFAMTVQSTVGFGDILPTTTLARVLVSLHILAQVGSALMI